MVAKLTTMTHNNFELLNSLYLNPFINEPNLWSQLELLTDSREPP